MDPQMSEAITNAASQLSPWGAILVLLMIAVPTIVLPTLTVIWQWRIAGHQKTVAKAAEQSPLLNGEGFKIAKQVAEDLALTRESSQTGNLLLRELKEALVQHDIASRQACLHAVNISNATEELKKQLQQIREDQRICLSHQKALSRSK